jgi:hypothetical protein
MEDKTPNILENTQPKLPLYKTKFKIPIVNITKNKEYNQEEINKFSFNRKNRRIMISMERTQPEKDRKFKIKLNLQEGKEAHQKAILRKQEICHLKAVARKTNKK